MSEELLYEIHDGIGRITFNRPQARNSFTFAMYERLREICVKTENDPSVKALVLTGAGGKAFAGRNGHSQFLAFSTGEDVMEYEARIERVVGALERCGIPTIAAIGGACTGGGFTIAGCCEFESAPPTPASACPSAARLAIAFRWRITRDWRHCWDRRA